MASPAETPTERQQRLANRQREQEEKERAAAGFIERLAMEKAERQKNNKRPTGTERLLAENKEKAEEEEMLKEEKQQRDLEKRAADEAARKRKAVEAEMRRKAEEAERQGNKTQMIGTERISEENVQKEGEGEKRKEGKQQSGSEQKAEEDEDMERKADEQVKEREAMEDERHQNNKRMTTTERLVAENKQKEEEDEMLKGEKRKRDLAQKVVEDAARERIAMEEEARKENDEGEEQRKAEERRREEATLEPTAEDRGGEDMMELDMSPIRGPHRSPLRKKKRKNKKRTKKDKASKAPAVQTYAEAAFASPPSLIRQGKFSGAKAPTETQREELLQTYSHKHKRYLWDMAIELGSEDKYAEFTLALRVLYENGMKVDDKLVIEPVAEGKGRKITRPEDISFNHTDLGMNMRVQGGGNAFAMKKPWKKNFDDADDDNEELINPVVKFTIAFSSDESPEDMMERVDAEWGKMGGRKTWPKAIPAFITSTPVVLYRVHNGGHRATLIKELSSILAEARDLATFEDPDFEFAHKPIPPMGLQPKVPRVPGQDTTVFTNWNKKQQWLRKCLHLEVDRNEAKMIQELVTIAKDRNLIAPQWGKSARLSNVADDDTRHVDLADLASYVKHHINYHASMTGDGLPGIINLDKEVPFYAASDSTKVMGHMSLRYALYRFIKLDDDHSLFAELHQESPLASVDAVIPNTPEAETMVLMMKRNIGAFLHFYLADKVDRRFLKHLLQASIDPSLLHDISNCTWDEKTKVLITPNEENDKNVQKMEDAAWYNDEFAVLTSKDGKKGTKKKTYANAEMLYDMDGEHSVHTLHNRPGKGYAGSPGAATLDLGNKLKNAGAINIEATEEDEMSVLSSLSKGELLERLRRATLSPKNKGSRPNNDNKSLSDDSGESSSYDSSSSSSSDAEVPLGQSAANRG